MSLSNILFKDKTNFLAKIIPFLSKTCKNVLFVKALLCFPHALKVQPLQTTVGLTKGLARHSILSLILKPGERKSVKVKFTPVLNKTVSSLIVIR